MTRILTGIQSSGDLHIGNYFGSMKPMIDYQDTGAHEMFFMIADLHSFTSKQDPELFQKNQRNCVVDWIAAGLDPDKSILWQQSDVRAHTELMWYLACLTPMGLMERAHSFKDKKAKGLEANVGLFTYPILMATDILLYDGELIPVGKDQKQHVEMIRDVAQKFNRQFGETFVLPEPGINETVGTIPGLDGDKMSKSYGNTIEIFAEEKILKKKIMSIRTDSVEMGTPLDPENCTVMQFHRLFENPNVKTLEDQYRNGDIGFGGSKKQLFELIWDYFAEARTKRDQLLAQPDLVEDILRAGSKKANPIAEAKLEQVRAKFGLSPQHL